MERNQGILILPLLVLLLMRSRVNGSSRLVGGRSEVTDVETNKEIQDLGRFAVDEYNRRVMEAAPPSPLREVLGGSNGPLWFLEVVEAQRQVVSGVKYYLKVAAMEDRNTRTFEAIVVVNHQSKQLLNFAPSRT